MVMVIVSIGAPLSLDCSVVSIGPVLRQNAVRRQVLDLSAPVARRSRLNGHSPAPPASTSPDALRRPPSGRPLENLALRHQLAVYKKTVNRPKLLSSDRLFWVALSRVWAGW